MIFLRMSLGAWVLIETVCRRGFGIAAFFFAPPLHAKGRAVLLKLCRAQNAYSKAKKLEAASLCFMSGLSVISSG
jgi:hypothetical protein